MLNKYKVVISEWVSGNKEELEFEVVASGFNIEEGFVVFWSDVEVGGMSRQDRSHAYRCAQSVALIERLTTKEEPSCENVQVEEVDTNA